jgi:hypothetical protein
MNLTPQEAADRLRAAPQTLAHWRNQRKGPPYIKFGRKILYPLEQLVEWEKRLTVSSS